MPIDVRLVNMPFWQAPLPALSLTQLKRRISDIIGSGVAVKIEYVNHDFARRLGARVYDQIASGEATLQSGFGDWIFRHIAFPNAPDNTAGYLRRYGRAVGKELCDLVAGSGPLAVGRLEATLDEIIQMRSLHKADVVGFTSTFAQTVPSLAMARLLRRRRPDQILILGGANCESEMGETLAKVVEDIDYVFSGPALVSLPEFLLRLTGGDLGRDAIQGVLPCASRQKRGAPTLPSPTISLGPELPIDVPVPLDYDDFMISYAQIGEPKTAPTLSFETSRGCWWGQKMHCTFCGLNGSSMAYRAMSPDMAREQITSLVNRYGKNVKNYNAVDNIMPKEYVHDLFRDLHLPSDIEIFYETKADLSDSHVKTLAAAGVKDIQPGIESLLTSTLKLMGKGTTAFHNIRLLMSCLRYNVKPHWNLLVGFPGESPDTFQTYQRLLPHLFHLFPPSGCFSVRFDRFSPYFNNAKRYDLDLEPAFYYTLCYPFSDEVIARIAYYFQNVNMMSAYYEPLAVNLGNVQQLAAEWNRRWFGPDANRPTLRLQPTTNGAIVHDGRGTEMQKIHLNLRHLNVLRCCLDAAELSTACKDKTAYDELAAWGLLFEERGRVLSLIDLEVGVAVDPMPQRALA